MLTYTFSFNRNAAGQTATIKTVDGSTVDSGTVASTPDTGGAYVYQAELDEGTYIGTVTAGGRTSKVIGLLDVPDSIEASGGGVGAAETAYFVATGPSDVTDGNGAAGNLNFVADDRHDALPSWVSIVDGDPVLNSDAGTCAWALTGVIDYDFSATTPPGAGGNIYSSFHVGTTLIGDTAAGDGQDTQTSPAVRGGGITFPGTLSAYAAPYADSDGSTNIADGTGTPRVALTVTRIAQAAVLPEPA